MDKTVEKELEDLNQLSELLQTVEENNNTAIPYTPNRAQRRADAKRNRALQKRNPRG